MKTILIIISLFFSLSSASEPIKFGPGPRLVGVDSLFMHAEGRQNVITGKIRNGELSFALYLQNYIDNSTYANTLSIIQYKDGLVYAPSEWTEEALNKNDQWLIATKEADNAEWEAYVNPIVNEILPCLQSIPAIEKEYIALESLIAGRVLDDGVIPDDRDSPKLSDAIKAAKIISQRYGQENGCVINHDYLTYIDIKRYLTDVVRYVLTGVQQSDYLVGVGAYFQMSQVFQIIFFEPLKRSSGPLYNLQMVPITDFLTLWSQTLLAEELPEDSYNTYLDLIKSIKSDQGAIDEGMLKNIALSCLGKEISAIFAKDFSLASCLNDDDLLRYDITFKNNHYHLYMPDR